MSNFFVTKMAKNVATFIGHFYTMSSKMAKSCAIWSHCCRRKVIYVISECYLLGCKNKIPNYEDENN